MYRKWTEDELVYLEYFVFENDTQLIDASKHLNRSTNAIRKKLCKMRKEDNFRCYMHRLWSEKEDEFLKKHYLSMKNKYIADRLNRTVGAVEFRAKKLGLTKHKKIKELDTEIRRLIDEDYYLSQICTKLNIKMSSLIAHCQREKIPYKKMPRTEYKNYGNHVWNVQDKVRFQEYLSKQELKASEEDDSKV